MKMEADFENPHLQGYKPRQYTNSLHNGEVMMDEARSSGLGLNAASRTLSGETEGDWSGSRVSLASADGPDNLVETAESTTPQLQQTGFGANWHRRSPSQSEEALTRVKFLCSFGGSIQMRPSDGKLRYVGGETRIVTVNRDINYSELMFKFTEFYGMALTLKYQLPNWDLDTLVTVSCDEDLAIMMEEYDLLEGRALVDGSQRLRVFLFSAEEREVPLHNEGAMQRDPYIDAINGRQSDSNLPHKKDFDVAPVLPAKELANFYKFEVDQQGQPQQQGVQSQGPGLFPQAHHLQQPLVAHAKPQSAHQPGQQSAGHSQPGSPIPRSPPGTPRSKAPATFDHGGVQFQPSHPHLSFQEFEQQQQHHLEVGRGLRPRSISSPPQSHADLPGLPARRESFKEPSGLAPARRDSFNRLEAGSPPADYSYLPASLPGSSSPLPNNIEPLLPSNPPPLPLPPSRVSFTPQDSHHEHRAPYHRDSPRIMHPHSLPQLQSGYPASGSQMTTDLLSPTGEGRQELPYDVPGAQYNKAGQQYGEDPSYSSLYHGQGQNTVFEPSSPASGGLHEGFRRQQSSKHLRLQQHPQQQSLQQQPSGHLAQPQHQPLGQQHQHPSQQHLAGQGQQGRLHGVASQGHLFQDHASHLHSPRQHHVGLPNRVSFEDVQRESIYQGGPLGQPHGRDTALRTDQLRPGVPDAGMKRRPSQEDLQRLGMQFEPSHGLRYDQHAQSGHGAYIPMSGDRYGREQEYVQQHRFEEQREVHGRAGQQLGWERSHHEGFGHDRQQEPSTSHQRFRGSGQVGHGEGQHSDLLQSGHQQLVQGISHGVQGHKRDASSSWQGEEMWQPRQPDQGAMGEGSHPQHWPDHGWLGGSPEDSGRGPLFHRVNSRGARLADAALPATSSQFASSIISPHSGPSGSSQHPGSAGPHFVEERAGGAGLYNGQAQGLGLYSQDARLLGSIKSSAGMGGILPQRQGFVVPTQYDFPPSGKPAQSSVPSTPQHAGHRPGSPQSAPPPKIKVPAPDSQPQPSSIEPPVLHSSGALAFNTPNGATPGLVVNSPGAMLGNRGNHDLQVGMAPAGVPVYLPSPMKGPAISAGDGGQSSRLGVETSSLAVADGQQASASANASSEEQAASKWALPEHGSQKSAESFKVSVGGAPHVEQSQSVSDLVAAGHLAEDMAAAVLQGGSPLAMRRGPPKTPFNSGVVGEDSVVAVPEVANGKVATTQQISSGVGDRPKVPSMDTGLPDDNVASGTTTVLAKVPKGAAIDDPSLKLVPAGEEEKVVTAAEAEEEAKWAGLQTIEDEDLEELKELGSGTFGTVFHGKWRGTDVAIKRLKSSVFEGRGSETDRTLADFWKEAKTLSELHHPNVVAFYGVVKDKEKNKPVATVTEFMVNGSLKQVLARKDRTIDRRKRILIAMDAAFGMEYLHSKHIVHFDLKCDNLLVNMRDPHRPICKVGDLGLSKVKKRTMVSGGVRGTLPWMAPELLDGNSSLVTEKVDVYSFGVVLWELLTGEEPYATMHYGAIIGGIVNNTLRPPVPSWCDRGWRALMEQCWQQDHTARPSFKEVASELRTMYEDMTPKAAGR